MSSLQYMAAEISYGTRWINLNDGINYKIGAEGTRDQVSKSWRKVIANSPILGGDYLVHAVPDMVQERVSVFIYGQTHTEVSDNLYQLQDLFEQYDYRIRWTFDEYREYWRCQLADISMSRGQIWTHSLMAKAVFTVPRYPDVTREHI
jgi:hypothetical protein